MEGTGQKNSLRYYDSRSFERSFERAGNPKWAYSLFDAKAQVVGL